VGPHGEQTTYRLLLSSSRTIKSVKQKSKERDVIPKAGSINMPPMKLVDLNLLLYAINSDSPAHPVAKQWVEETLSGDELVAIP